MGALLVAQVAVGLAPFDLDRAALDPGLFSFESSSTVTFMPWSSAQRVYMRQHQRPVLGISASTPALMGPVPSDRVPCAAGSTRSGLPRACRRQARGRRAQPSRLRRRQRFHSFSCSSWAFTSSRRRICFWAFWSSQKSGWAASCSRSCCWLSVQERQRRSGHRPGGQQLRRSRLKSVRSTASWSLQTTLSRARPA